MFLLLMISYTALNAQHYNPLSPYRGGGQTGQYDDFKKRYDYEQFLLQQQQSEALLGADSINLIRQKIETTPEELRKLGVSEELIEQLTRLNVFQDSLRHLGVKIQLERDAENDTLSIEDLQEIIDFQKDELIRKALSLPQVEVYGQSFFRNNIVKLFDQQTVSNRPANDYVIGAGDEFNVVVWGRNDVTHQHVVDAQGSIHPELVGKIYLKGLSFEKAKALIIERYRKVYGGKDNEIEVSINFNRLISVNLVGELFNPGTYTFSAMNSAFNALVAIDGPNNMGTVRDIYIKRDGQVVQELDVYKYLLDPISNQNFFLEGNDYVFVPTQGNIVTIDGAIKRPMKYEMKQGEGLKDLIKYAGGLSEKAHSEHLSIRRFENNKEQFLEVSLDSLSRFSQDFMLMNGDSIFVKSISTSMRNFVNVRGAMRVPGDYLLRSQDRVADVLFRAGGPADFAALDKGFVFRTSKNTTREILPFKVSEVLVQQSSQGNFLLEPNDSIFVLSLDSIRQEFPVYISGEVKNPGTYQFGENLRLNDLILLAGNFKREAARSQIEVTRVLDLSVEDPQKGERIVVKRADINYDLSLQSADGSFLLQPFDRIFIRRSPNFEIQQDVVLMGEVKYPGEYSLINKGEKIHSLINRAGGFTDYAFRSASKLIRKEEGEIFVDLDDVFENPQESNYNYILSNKDTIVVPKLRNYVTLKGEIKYFIVDTLAEQINVPFEEGKKADYYVKKYGGGFGKYGKKSGTFVQYPNGEVRRANNFLVFKEFPEVENGSTIIVDISDRKKFEEERRKRKRERKFDWNRAIDSIASAMITLLTVAVLIFQLRGT